MFEKMKQVSYITTVFRSRDPIGFHYFEIVIRFKPTIKISAIWYCVISPKITFFIKMAFCLTRTCIRSIYKFDIISIIINIFFKTFCIWNTNLTFRYFKFYLDCSLPVGISKLSCVITLWYYGISVIVSWHNDTDKNMKLFFYTWISTIVSWYYDTDTETLSKIHEWIKIHIFHSVAVVSVL